MVPGDYHGSLGPQGGLETTMRLLWAAGTQESLPPIREPRITKGPGATMRTIREPRITKGPGATMRTMYQVP